MNFAHLQNIEVQLHKSKQSDFFQEEQSLNNVVKSGIEQKDSVIIRYSVFSIIHTNRNDCIDKQAVSEPRHFSVMAKMNF